jgi:protein KRI1
MTDGRIELKELDLDGEWDPEAHDRQMGGIYGEDEVDAGDMEKPTWDDDIDIGNIVPPDDEEETTSKKKKKKKDKKKRKDGNDEEAGVDLDAMVADQAPPGGGDDDEEWDGTEEMRKRKVQEYMDEVYGLEFNDIVRASHSKQQNPLQQF